MAEIGAKQRPVRKLIVDNFSVIKHAELEFGKITVLIGPQASGKSLLCRLAFFLQQVVVEQAEEAIKASEEFEQFRQRVRVSFHYWFTSSAFPSGPIQGAFSEISYTDGAYEVRVSHKRLQESNVSLQVDLSESIERCYKSVLGKLNEEKLRRESLPNPKFFAEEIRDRLLALRNEYSPEVYSYIPSTRSFFLSIYQAIFGASTRLDDIPLRFSQDFNYGFERRIPKAGLDHSLTQWINAESEQLLQGKVVPTGADYEFRSFDGRTLRLPVLSSGTQELLPLMTCLREFVAASAGIRQTANVPPVPNKRLFFVEEPESNVFPSTQYDLVRIFARMSNEPILDASWVITTHSPYILSSFNNLIYAGQIGRDKRLAKKIKIDEKFWVEPGTFRAYSIHDGKLESILSESGLIDGDYLDSVSETIGNEFDDMLRLEYGAKKAS